MKLTGTLDERIHSAVEFLKANRMKEYDHDKYVAAYRKAGIPFTDAADRLFAEWVGVWDGVCFYEHAGSPFSLDFFIDLFHDPKVIRRYYGGFSKSAYGKKTIPIGYGGYYYYADIYLTADGKIVAYHDYNWERYIENDGHGEEHDSLEDFAKWELFHHPPEQVEKIMEIKEFYGTLEERVAAEIAYIQEHGGFASCRLMNSAGIPCPVPADREFSNAELTELLMRFFTSSKPENPLSTDRVWWVKE